jgi:hypothetical protein
MVAVEWGWEGAKQKKRRVCIETKLINPLLPADEVWN